MTLPIVSVDRLGELPEFHQEAQLSHMGDLVLDAGWEPAVELVA